MSIYENLTNFAGLPVVDFRKSGDIKDFAAVAPRVRCTYDDSETLVDFLTLMFAEPGIAATKALVLGAWMENGESYEISPAKAIEFLVARKDALPNLKALFIGDIISEENEMSWIEQTDLAPIWAAFPLLEEVGVRGGNNLRLSRINHSHLRKLVVQTGGMAKNILTDAFEANAPLEHLELWLGSDDYGADTSVKDLEPIMAGGLFPALTYLGLCNSEYSDEIATRLASAPIMERIETLDLSGGTLKDAGAQALMASGQIGRLKALNISHHYVSAPVLADLAKATPKLIHDDPQTADEWDGEKHYYIAVAE